MPSFNIPYFAEKLQSTNDGIFFVQIGAMDGRTHDPIYHLVKSYGWKGILVEPLQDHFENLKLNYADHEGLIFENVAITEAEGISTMHRIPTHVVQENDIPPWGMGAGSFFLDRNALAWEEIKPLIVQEEVQCMSLGGLLKKHEVKEIHFFQLDTEGYDYRILRQLNFEKYKPQIINLEIVNLTKSELGHCKQLLDKYDYLYAKTGYDLLAVSKTLLP